MNSTSKRIKILIVDDSRIFRSAIQEILCHEENIEIVGSVWNGIKALEFIKSNPPDLVTLDVQMPDMDGLQTLRAIQEINAANPDNQIGVIMLSSHTQKGADITVKALEMGAFDFIPKPEHGNLRDNITNLCQQLVDKIQQYSKKIKPAVRSRKKVSDETAVPEREKIPSLAVGVNAVIIGVSTGGPKALAEILPPLCEKIDVPIFIVQHMPPTFTESLARSLDSKCRYTVTEGSENDIAQPKHVYIAPGGRHMKLFNDRAGKQVRIKITDDPPLKGCRPSVDVLFETAAEVYGKNIIAVVLTGMGTDGTAGAGILKNKGARIIAQDEESSVVWGMPGSIIHSGLADDVIPLDKIPRAIVAMMKKQGAAVA